MGMSAHEISNIIAGLLTQKGWSQAELARRMGIAPVTLINLLKGNRRWHLEQLERAANEMGVPLTSITGAVPIAGKQLARLCVEPQPGELKRFREIAASEMRTPENLLHWLLVRYIGDKTER
jgi:transcriptional regulator with XRE-family HTH domain